VAETVRVEASLAAMAEATAVPVVKAAPLAAMAVVATGVVTVANARNVAMAHASAVMPRPIQRWTPTLAHQWKPVRVILPMPTAMSRAQNGLIAMVNVATVLNVANVGHRAARHQATPAPQHRKRVNPQR
jgi:hypothetical protein